MVGLYTTLFSISRRMLAPLKLQVFDVLVYFLAFLSPYLHYEEFSIRGSKRAWAVGMLLPKTCFLSSTSLKQKAATGITQGFERLQRLSCALSMLTNFYSLYFTTCCHGLMAHSSRTCEQPVIFCLHLQRLVNACSKLCTDQTGPSYFHTID